MVYVKSILAGLAAAVLSLALLVATTIVPSLREQSSGLGAVAGGISVIPLLIVGTIMFVVGFTWAFRRSLRRPSPH